MNAFGQALTLKQTLIAQAKSPLLMDQALHAAEPLFEAAIAGLRLAPACDVDLEAVRSALAASTEHGVQRVVTLSAAKPLGPQEWAADNVQAAMTLERLTRQLRQNINGWSNYGLNYVESVLYRTENSRAFAQNVWTGLIASLEPELRALAGNDLGSALSLGLWHCVFHYFGYAVTGRAAETGLQTPLIRLLPGVIPLGRRLDQTDTWVVLTA